MRRREFIRSLAAAWLMAGRAWAQQPAKVYRIALVHASHKIVELTETGSLRQYRGFNVENLRSWQMLFQELQRLGYVEGQNIIIERYSAEGRVDQYPVLASEVVRLKPDLIVSFGPLMTWQFKMATRTIPVISQVNDPVAMGIVTNIARPGGNITGVAGDLGLEIWGKRLQLLKQAIPTLSRVGFLASREAWEDIYPYGPALREAARSMGIAAVGLVPDKPMQEPQYRRLFAAMAVESPDALIIVDDPPNYANAPTIVELCGKVRLPTIAPYREFAVLGALMVYGPDYSEVARHLARIIDQILKGANPGDIPYYQSTKFEFIINLKTARALSMTIPPSLLARADELIE